VSKRKDLAAVIADRYQAGKTDGLAKSIAAYLLETNQTIQLDSLIRDVKVLREQSGHIEAEVFTAHDLNENALEDVKSLIKTTHPEVRTVAVVQTLDPTVIGGLKIRLAQEQLDMSIRSKLDTFKRLTTKENK
jgi:F-type H+-transporting ATPase subunit delta